MALLAKDNPGVEFELTPPGNHIARCYMVCDLGMQDVEYMGNTSQKRKVRLAFELPNELMQSDGRPFSVSKNYTLSLNEKANLRADLQAWRGRAFTEQELQGFDLFNVLGAPCMVNVIHTQGKNGNTYANIAGITPLPKGIQCPPAVNAPIKFSLDEFDQKIYDGLPEWLQQKINTKGVEQPYDQSQPSSLYDVDLDDDIPF